MAANESSDWLVRLYDEQGETLHRLVVLLGAEEQSGRIVRSALLALHRRSHRLIDPAERVEFLQEHVVHLARAVRGTQAQLSFPCVPEARQTEILKALGAMAPRQAELLVVSHYLSVFGPPLAGIMRMSVRGANQRLESALETLRGRVGDPTPGSQPGVLESLSQETTAALRSGARLVQAPGTETLEGELLSIAEHNPRGIGPRMVVILTVIAILLGLIAAAVTRPQLTPAEPSELPSTTASTSEPTESLPAQVRGIGVYYVGRQDGKLYRELRDLPSTGDLVRSALDAVLTLAPLDPDYHSVWGPGQLLDAEIDGDVLTVNLSADAFADIASPVAAAQARNQFIYTVTDLVANPALRVRFRSESGEPPAAFADDDGYQRLGLEPMPPVWINTPANASTLTGDKQVISGLVLPGVGVPTITLTNTESGTVTKVTAQASQGVDSDGWRSWSATVSLAPGPYDIQASVQAGTPPTIHSENKSVKVS